VAGAQVTEKWSYGKAGDRYPVKRHDIWRVGRHVLHCGDIEASAHAGLMGLLPPAMLYMDLPFDQANLTLYRKKAGAAKGQDLTAFLHSVVAPLSRITGDIYIETGNKAADAVAAALEEAGAKVLNRWGIYYYGTKPCVLLRSSFHDVAEMTASPQGMDDADTPEWAIEHSSKPGDIVADFCVGQGLTAVAAARLGRRALGMDINGRRLAVTIDKLVKMGEGVAEKTSSIR
jgi:hypothetical protein